MKIRNKLILIIIAALMLLIHWSTLSFQLGINNEVLVGQNLLKMKAGWAPISVNSDIGQVIYTRDTFFLFPQKMGSATFLFLENVSAAYILAAKNNSQTLKRYSWGTALLLKNSFYRDFLNLNPDVPRTMVFVPEVNVLIDLSNLEDLEEIISLRRRSNLSHPNTP